VAHAQRDLPEGSIRRGQRTFAASVHFRLSITRMDILVCK